MKTIEERLSRLEKTNRRYRATLLMVSIGAAALIMSGFQRTGAPPDLVANSLRIIDAKGKTVVNLEPIGIGGGRVTIRNNSLACGVHLLSDQQLTCRANLQTMANAIQAFRVKSRLTMEQLNQRGVTPEDFKEDLQMLPICPSQGTYSFEQGQKFIAIRCSIPTHGTFEPGIDGN